MERLLSIILIAGLFAITSAFAQTYVQSGLVKTPGRLVNGKVVPGMLLQGAVVRVDGRQAVVAKDGRFSFPVKGGSFTLKSVSKQGYKLMDVEVCRQYQYSATPLYILMYDPDKQQSEQLAKERKLRRELQRRLQQREDEIEEMQLSLEEKNRLLAEINQQRDDNEKIIKGMAQYYATLDYDQLDEFQQNVCGMLEEGRLEQADSLLRTRGDIYQRIKGIREEHAFIVQEQANLDERRKLLDKSKEGTQKKMESIAADCYSFYQRFLMAHKNDSAASYLELRASLDTTNIEWQTDAGDFMEGYIADYSKALDYYQRALRLSLLLDDTNGCFVAKSYCNVGDVCLDKDDFDKAFEYYNKALERSIKNSKYGGQLSGIYNCLGHYYDRTHNYVKALEFYDKKKKIDKKMYGKESLEFANSLNSIGCVYTHMGRYSKALKCFETSLAIKVGMCDADDPYFSIDYNNIGMVHAKLGEFDKALEFYAKSLNIHKKNYGEKHPLVANSYLNMGAVYLEKMEFATALDYFGKATEIDRMVYGENSTAIAAMYNQISNVYLYSGDYEIAIEKMQKSLDIRLALYGDDNYAVAISYDNMAYLYEQLANYDKALYFYRRALKSFQSLQESVPDAKENIIELKEKIRELESENN